MIVIEVRALPCTNTKPRRYVATTCQGHRLISTYVDDAGGGSDQNYERAARRLVRELFPPFETEPELVGGQSSRGYVFVLVPN